MGRVMREETKEAFSSSSAEEGGGKKNTLEEVDSTNIAQLGCAALCSFLDVRRISPCNVSQGQINLQPLFTFAAEGGAKNGSKRKALCEEEEGRGRLADRGR